jgi:adenylate cyclase
MSADQSDERKLGAIMFTDMVGYSALAHGNEPLALELLEEHRRLLRAVFPQFDGREVETTGDGFLVEFGSALNAVQCAVQIQQALADRNQTTTTERKVRIRIGIHVGDVIHRDGHVLGDGVNIAARIEPLAEPGGIAVSQQVFDQIQNKLAQPLVAIGKVELKNIRQPVSVFRVQLSGKVNDPTQPVRSALPPPPQTSDKAIGVLPFLNISADPGNEYLSDGITEDLITMLSHVPGLRVSARTSSFAFKNKAQDMRRIGEALGVSLLLEGSVRKADNRLRITAQLISVADGCHLWAERYDREMKDVFAVQDEISRAICEALKLQFAEDRRAAALRRQTANSDAYELYLKGRYFWNQRGRGLLKGLHYFELALLEDPDYALAYTGLSDTYNLLNYYGILPPHDAIAKAKTATERALQLDDSLPEAHVSVAFYRQFCAWDVAGAEAEFLRALELNPNTIQGRYWYACHLSFRGLFDVAVTHAQLAVRTEPFSAIARAVLGWTYLNAHRYAEATEHLRKSIELESDFVLSHWLLGLSCVGQSRQADAIAELETAVRLFNRGAWALGALGYAWATFGQRAEALAALEELRQRSASTYVTAHSRAMICVGLGDSDQALTWLERSYEEKGLWVGMLKVDPVFDSLRHEPRFISLLRKTGLER